MPLDQANPTENFAEKALHKTEHALTSVLHGIVDSYKQNQREFKGDYLAPGSTAGMLPSVELFDSKAAIPSSPEHQFTGLEPQGIKSLGADGAPSSQLADRRPPVGLEPQGVKPLGGDGTVSSSQLADNKPPTGLELQGIKPLGS